MHLLGEVLPWWAFTRRAACPHVEIQSISGDQANYTPRFSRMRCRRCRRYLDGPVQIALDRRELATKYQAQEA